MYIYIYIYLLSKLKICYVDSIKSMSKNILFFSTQVCVLTLERT